MRWEHEHTEEEDAFAPILNQPSLRESYLESAQDEVAPLRLSFTHLPTLALTESADEFPNMALSYEAGEDGQGSFYIHLADVSR